MNETVTATIDAKLADDIERFVPPRYRGERKLSMRIELILREYMETAEPYRPDETEPPELGGHVDATA